MWKVSRTNENTTGWGGAAVFCDFHFRKAPPIPKSLADLRGVSFHSSSNYSRRPQAPRSLSVKGNKMTFPSVTKGGNPISRSGWSMEGTWVELARCPLDVAEETAPSPEDPVPGQEG